MKAVILFAFLSACVLDGGPPDPEPILCGEMPVAPGFAAYFDGTGHAVMSIRDYQALVEFRDKAHDWFNCFGHAGGER